MACSLAAHSNIKIENSVDDLLNKNFVGYNGKFSLAELTCSWKINYLSWKKKKDFPGIIIKYEDLLENPFLHFKSLIKFLRIEAEDDLITEAISNSEFEKLQKKESFEGGFLEKPDHCDKFFRSGKAGEGLKKLNDMQIEKIVKKFSVTLKKFKYLD